MNVQVVTPPALVVMTAFLLARLMAALLPTFVVQLMLAKVQPLMLSSVTVIAFAAPNEVIAWLCIVLIPGPASSSMSEKLDAPN